MDVRTLCLGVLSDVDRTGYEIKKTLEDNFRYFFRASYGSIYPALADLERSGLVTVRAVEQGRRPEKRVYRITADGREALRRALVAEEPRHVVRSEFLALMYFAHLLPVDRLGVVLDRMTAEFEQVLGLDLESFERRKEALTPGQCFALGYGQAVLRAALAYIDGHRDGLQREASATIAEAMVGFVAEARAGDERRRPGGALRVGRAQGDGSVA